MKNIALGILILLTLSLFAVPEQLSFQGRITESDGTPYHGMHDMDFRIYDSESGGTLLWSETQSIDIQVGYYHVFLGSTVDLPRTVFSGAEIWLEIEIESEILYPRNKLVTVPYSYRSAVAESLVGGAAMGDTLRANWAYIHDIPADLADGDDIGFLRLRANSEPWITSEATFAEGTAVTLDQTGSTITINADDSPDEDWEIIGDNLYPIPTGNIIIGTSTPDAENRLHVVGNGSTGERAIFGKSSTSGAEGWLGTEQYGVYGNYNPDNFGYLGASGYGLFAKGETHAGYFEGDVTVYGDINLGPEDAINVSATARLIIDSDAGSDDILHSDASGNLYWGPDEGIVDPQDDVDVPLTSPGDFNIISSATDVHGALDELDEQIETNMTDISDHIAADGDLADDNELNTSLSFNDGTNTLTITDAGGDLTTIIDNEADDLSDNYLGDLSDVSTTGASTDQVLQFDGTNWVPGTVSAEDNQTDVEVPLTSTGDFSIISGETEVHGALVDLDTQVETNQIDISAHLTADDDMDDTNELNASVNFNDGTNTLTITDAGGDLTTIIDNEADDLSDNYLGDLSDVSTTGASTDQVLQFDGTNWVPGTVSAEDNQTDVEVPLTSTGDFSIISGETEVHGALVDLDTEIAALSSAGYVTDLQSAYNGGNTIDVIASTPVTINASGDYNRGLDICAENSKAIRVENASTDDDRATFHAFNASNGTAFYCSGHYRISGTSSVRTYSNAGLHFQLDRNNEPTTNDSFTVRDGNDDVIFSIHEDRSVDMLGELDMHSNQIKNVATATVTGDALPYGQTAEGDLSGSYPAPTVDGLQGRTIASTAPSSGQVLGWDGSSWAPVDDNGGTDDQTLAEVYAESGNIVDMSDGDILFRTPAGADTTLFIDDDGQVGIGNADPSNRLDITDNDGFGAIRIGEILEDSLAGAIRYSGGHFEGYDGTEWLSFDEAVDEDWIITDSVLYTHRLLGIAKGGAGNNLYGSSIHTHVNLGINSNTGEDGVEQLYVTVAGGEGNTAIGSYAVVAGGQNNQAQENWTAITGGYNNQAGNYYSFVGGGYENIATGTNSVVCGGNSNQSSGYGFIGGGSNNNIALGTRAVIAGGDGNTIYGEYSSIVGGQSNTVFGNLSFAFGYNAQVPAGEDRSAVFNWTDGDGTVFIETDALTTGYELYVNGSALASGGTWDTSDMRFKTNINTVYNALNIVDRLRPVRFEWKDNIEFKTVEDQSIGFIAQELDMVLPELVTIANNDDGSLAVNYNGIIPINTAAIKELVNRTENRDENLQNQIDDLRQENNKLRLMLEELKRQVEDNK